MRTKEQYFEDLKKLKPNLYFNGEIIGRDHEVMTPSLNVMGVTFDAVQNPETVELCTATAIPAASLPWETSFWDLPPWPQR